MEEERMFDEKGQEYWYIGDCKSGPECNFSMSFTTHALNQLGVLLLDQSATWDVGLTEIKLGLSTISLMLAAVEYPEWWSAICQQMDLEIMNMCQDHAREFVRTLRIKPMEV